MWKAIASGAAHRLSSGGWIANFVIGLAFLMLSPILGKFMQRPRAAIVSAAIGLTIIIWVGAWAAYRAVPNATSVANEVLPSDASSGKNMPVLLPKTETVATEQHPPNDSQQATVKNSPNAQVYQAGRDVVINNQSPQHPATIRSIVLEVRLTCDLVPEHGELPPDEVPFMPIGNADAYLDGAAGRQRLTFVSPVRFRKLVNNKIVVINRFALDPGGDLTNQPVSSLSNYDKVVAPVISIVWGKELARFTLLELSISLNGAEPAYYRWVYNDPFKEGPVFTVPFADLRKKLQDAGSPR